MIYYKKEFVSHMKCNSILPADFLVFVISCLVPEP